MATADYRCPNCEEWYDGESCANCGYINEHVARILAKKHGSKYKKKKVEKDDRRTTDV